MLAGYAFLIPSSHPPHVSRRLGCSGAPIKRTLLVLLLALSPLLRADPVPVRLGQGSYRGFLSLHTMEGKLLATGDLVQVAHGDRVTSHLTFHFRDGSVDEETTVFTQRQFFQFVSDHHIQRGPSFPKPMDMLVEANGDVTLRNLLTNETTTDRLQLPADISNGLLFILFTNLPSTPETRISYVLPSGKGRLVHLSIKPDGSDSMRLDGVNHRLNAFRVHVELGGVAGVVAPMIGKEPADYRVLLLPGESPAVVRVEGQLYEGGPIWCIQLVSPTFAAR